MSSIHATGFGKADFGRAVYRRADEDDKHPPQLKQVPTPVVVKERERLIVASIGLGGGTLEK